MSQEALSEFMSKVAKDTALQDGIRGLAEGSGDDAVVPTGAFVEFAQGMGFEFTTEEAAGLFELGAEELDSVSGGVHPPEMTARNVGFAKRPERYGKPIPACRFFDLTGFKFF